MICRISKTVEPSPDNVLAVVRNVGQTVRLQLPDGSGVIEVTVDEVRGSGVGLVFAVSKPFKIVRNDD